MFSWLLLAFAVGLIAVIYIFIEVKRFRHKITALFLIGLIILFVVSMMIVFAGEDIDFKSIDGAKEAGGLYLSWLKVVFVNLKTLTSNAIHMDWKENETES